MLALLDTLRTVKLVDVVTLEERALFEVSPGEMIKALAFSPDGRRLAAGPDHGGSLHVWDLGQIRRRLSLMGLDWRPAAETVRAAEDSKPMKVAWDVTTLVAQGAKSRSWLSQVARYTKAINAHPNAPGPYWQRGRAYIYLRRYAEAVQDCTRALERKPDLQDALFWRGRGFMHWGKYAEAAADFQRSLEIRPNDAWCCRHLAAIYVLGPPELRDAQRALPLALKAVEMGTRSERGRKQFLETLGIVYFRLERFDDARQILDQLLASPPHASYPTLRLFHASCLHHLGRADEARQAYEDAIRCTGRNPSLPPSDLAALRQQTQELLGIEDAASGRG
jgi:tetratricopeptide (TPR) repeat protein